MAATASLCFAGNNRLRYLITGDEVGGAVTIDNDGSASPDLQTDSPPGPLKQLALAGVNGIGTVAAGALTQAQARSAYLSDDDAAVIGNSRVPRAICRFTPRTAGATPSSVDANVDGENNPVLTVTVPADSVGYLDIELAGGIGVSAG